MKSYNITLTEAELLDVVTALEAAPYRVLCRGLRRGPVGIASLSRQIADQAVEQFHESLSQRIADQAAKQFYDAHQQLSLPYGPPSEWSYV